MRLSNSPDDCRSSRIWWRLTIARLIRRPLCEYAVSCSQRLPTSSFDGAIDPLLPLSFTLPTAAMPRLQSFRREPSTGTIGPEAGLRSRCQARGTARASLSVVTHPEHEIFHALNERMFFFNLVRSVVEPHVVHQTLALTCNDLHDVPSKGLAGGISRIA